MKPHLVVAALAFASAVHAQEYPSKPIRLLVPYSPGGPVDIVARLTAQKLTDELKQQVIVDNRAGGGGNIAVEIVARSLPDGYTLMMGANGTNAINPNLYPKLPVDPAKDLAPIGMVASSPMILVTHPSVPANSIRELVALAKARPGAINFASSGNGSTAHLSSELFKSMAGVNIVHVPYKGAGPALTDLVGGQVQIMFTGISSTLPYVKSSRLKALGVSSEKRVPILPDVPAVNEEIAGYEVTTWYGVFAPVQIPKPYITRLNQTLAAIFATPDARQRLSALGADPMTMSPEQFAAAIRRETAKWAKLIKESGVRPD
ncbi:MAG: tripartite tricarboxylate transporter receptor family protein [Betaproteobacteria bacterium]|nr:tripartite tricarboxylate transporter receptor family protein [Betaproteobacteria bacterium]